MFLEPHYKLQDRYEIRKVLGKGNYGIVYLAYDWSLTSDVAIKELAPEWLSDETVRIRFINDARAMRQLEYPNIVTVYDLLEPDKHPVENYYIIMQYVKGGSLEDLLRQRHTLPIRDALEIIIYVCKGLAEAHKAGIIHRDIKPDNILIGERGEAKLGDFGVAHIPGLWASPGSQHGTIHWLSPEQAKDVLEQLKQTQETKKQKEIDKRSDLYSTSAVLYRMLTGKHYFDFDACVARAKKNTHLLGLEQMRRCIFREICNTIVDTFPVKPSTYRTEIPEQLNVRVLKGLNKNPDDRFQTADEMVEDFESIAKLITTDTEDNSLQRAEKLLEENRFDEAHRIVIKVIKKNTDNINAIELMGQIHWLCREYSQAVDQWQKAMKLQPDRRSLYPKLGNLYCRIDHFDEATQTFRKGLELCPDDPALFLGLAKALWENGQPQEAIEALKTSCELLPDERKEALLLQWKRELKDARLPEDNGDNATL